MLEKRQLLSIPAAPGALHAAAGGSSGISVGWTDNSSNESGFVLDRATDSAFSSNLSSVSLAANATSYGVTGLSADTRYYFRVRAYNGDGSSSNSTAVNTATMTTAGTFTLDPDSNISGGTWPSFLYTNIGKGTRQPTAPSQQYYAQVLMAAKNWTSEVGLSTVTLQTGATVSSVTLWAYTGSDWSPGDLVNWNLRVGGTLQSSQQQTIGSTNAWSSFTWSGLSLSQSDLDGMQVSANAVHSGGQVTYVYHVYAEVTPSGGSNAAPTVATAAAASPGTVTATTTDLSALGADDGGESALTYSWSVTSKPAGAADPTFSVNSTNGAKNTTATFTAAGAYTFTATITDGGEAMATSSVNVSVNQTITSILLSPNTTSVELGASGQFTASAKDQFGNSMTPQPTITWSVDSGGVGTVNSSGLYTTVGGSTGSATLRATSGSMSAAAAVTVTPAVIPTAPSGLTAYNGQPFRVTLNWSDNSNNENGFVIQMATDPTFTFDFATVNVSAGTVSYMSDYLIGNAPYHFRVRANGTAGLSDYSNTATASPTAVAGMPPVPASPAATVNSSTQVSLSWSDLSGMYNEEDGFLIERATNSGFSSGLARFTVGADVVSFVDTTCTAATGYYYRIRAFNGSGWSNASTVSNVTTLSTPNAAPTIATAAAATPAPVTGTTTVLSVLGADDGGESTLNYSWSVTSRPTDAPLPTIAISGTNAAKSTLVTFGAAGSYTFVVVVQDGSGLAVASSVSVQVQQTTSAITVSPGTLSLQNGQTRQFTASASDQFGHAMTIAPSFSWGVDAGGIGGITPAGVYNAPGFGTGSATVRVSVGAISATAAVTVAVATVPAAPTGLTATGGMQQVTLNWTDASDNETGFVIEQASTPDFEEDFASTLVAADTTSHELLGGFISNATYYFRVKAIGLAGDSAYSGRVSAVPTPYFGAQVPLAPTNATATVVSPTQIRLNWTDPSTEARPATGFVIERSTSSDFTLNYVRIYKGQGITTCTDSDLDPGTTYYYRVRASNDNGWSAFSGDPIQIRTTTDRFSGIGGSGDVAGLWTYQLNCGFAVDANVAFNPAGLLGNYTLTFTAPGTPQPFTWVDLYGQGHNATRTIVQSVIVTATLLENGVWTYKEVLDYRNTIDVLADEMAPDTTEHRVIKDKYTFTASGDASHSGFEFTSEGSDTITGLATYGSLAGDITQEWTQESTHNAMISNDSANGVVSNPESEQGGDDTYDDIVTIPYSDGEISGTAVHTHHLEDWYTLTDSLRTYHYGTGDGLAYLGSGSYFYTFPGGSAHGSLSEIGHNNQTYTITVWQAPNALGAWVLAGGTETETSDVYDHVSYVGGGEYSGLNEQIQLTQNDGSNTSWSGYIVSSAPVGREWFITEATGNGGYDNWQAWAYEGSGTYSGPSSSGTTSSYGDGYWGDNASWSVEAGTDGEWQLITGSGLSSGHSHDFYSYEGGGTYWLPTGGGTTTEGGEQDTSDWYTIPSLVMGGEWVDSGSSGGEITNSGYETYNGSATYNNGSTAGTTSNHGGSNWYSHTNWELSLGSDDEWTLVDGTGSDSGGAGDYWSSSGSGAYSTSGDGWTMAGDINESTTDGYSTSGYSIDSDVVNGAWVTTGGTSTGTYGYVGHYDYNGSGTYWYGFNGGSVSGDQDEFGIYDWTTESSWTDTLLTDGSWALTSGTGEDTGSWHEKYWYLGDGTYTYSNGSGGGDGTVDEDGSNDRGSSGYNVDWDVVNGVWAATGGGNERSSEFGTHWSYDGSGLIFNEYADEIGSDLASGHDDRDASRTWQESWNGEAWIPDSGNGDGMVDNGYEYSYILDDVYEEGAVFGTIHEDGDDNQKWKFTTTEEVIAGEWVVDGSGTGESWGHQRLTWDGFADYTREFDLDGTLPLTYHEDGVMGTWYDYTYGETLHVDGTTTYNGDGESGRYRDSGYTLSADEPATASKTVSTGSPDAVVVNGPEFQTTNQAYSTDHAVTTFLEGGELDNGYEWKNTLQRNANGTWKLVETRETDEGTNNFWSEYTYNDTYHDEALHETSDYNGYVVGNRHLTDNITEDSVSRSNGRTFSSVTTIDYRGAGDPVVTEENSDNVWTHEETHHYVTRDTEAYDWGTYNGSSWENRFDITGGDEWDGGADTEHGFISSDDPSEQPQVIDEDNSWGTGSSHSLKTVTADGVTQTIWNTNVPLTEYIGRREDGTSGGAQGLSGDSGEVPAPTTGAGEASDQDGGSWIDGLQTGLDVAGILDPTPICDGINTVVSLLRGRWADAWMSGISMLPYAGDAIGKGGKLVKKIVAATGEKVAEKALARGAARAVEEGAEKFVSKTVREAQRIGCFVAGTEVLMGDGSEQQIQLIQVGDRVATDGGVANSADGTAAEDPNATAVDPDTWRLVTITVDDWQVQTLQPLTWIESHNLDDGDQIDLTEIVDLQEMGVPEGLSGTVDSISACPDIETGSGRVVLMTVSHLNSDVYTLTLTDGDGMTDNLGITGTHRVYTEDRGWVQAQDLLAGEDSPDCDRHGDRGRPRAGPGIVPRI